MTAPSCRTCGGPIDRSATRHGGRPRLHCHRCRPPGASGWSVRRPVSPETLLHQHHDKPTVLAAGRVALELGEAWGWPVATIAAVVGGLTVVLADHPGPDPVLLSELRRRTPTGVSATRVAEVLAELNLLNDDTTPAIRTWIDRRTGELPAGFGAEVRGWLLLLLDGDARTRPRAESSVYAYFGSVRPILAACAATRDHLREVTPADITAALQPLRGHRRRNTITALRSLFRFAKKRRIVFTDPTTRLNLGSDIERSAVPMTAAEIRTVEQTAGTAGQRLVVALAAVHAARAHQIRQLTLDDIDLPNRRITIDGHPQRLGELAYRALRAWLHERRTRWPHTANRHILISRSTALGTEPVSNYYLKKHLLLRGVHLEHIRADRVLHEALTVGPDPLHLALVFNIHHTTANAYATIARQLLDGPIEHAVTPDDQHT